MAKDMGAGITQHQPVSHTMEYYAQVQKSAGYDERGNPKNVGHQSDCLGGAGQHGGDPTKHMENGEGWGTLSGVNEGPNQVVSKKHAEVHKGPRANKSGKKR